ncbi:DUF547 domain-containing protein [Winogradskyella ursingii]|uniref:DUF547 domain-containing protein n=1 Tax=Winogradskyella ursingii TaxID=2686079 RepID=UPI0015C71F38|nr:DUF547 domain-containing protein [Winogradskyella ursingii]
MKKLSILLLITVFISSCSAKKQTVNNSPKKEIEMAVVTEVPDVIEKEVEIENEVDTKVEKTETITDSVVEDLSFHQELKKRFYDNHELWDELLSKHVSEQGNVNYKGFSKDSDDLSLYIKMLKIGHTRIDELSKEKQLAFWINTYNALTVDLILRNYPTKSIKDIKDPWDQRLWKFGEKWMNLNDIEHQILRKMNEPRIHFAIVCASVSCPKLQKKAFTAENLEAQLTNATKEFLSDNSKNEISKDELKLSKIFRWFKIDFEQNGSLIDFLNEYADIAISQSANVRYQDYNWDLNN